MNRAIINHIDRKVGKGWKLVPAIRIEANFSADRDEDKTCVDNMRIMVFPAPGDKWVFRSSALHAPYHCTYHTSLSWSEDEITAAYDIGDFTRMLVPDPLDSDVFYIIYHDDSYHWRCREVEEAVNRLVRGIMHPQFQDNYVWKNKHAAKSVNETEKRNVAFKEIMMNELLPSLHRLFMIPLPVCDETVELDPMRVGEDLDRESASVFVAHAK